MFSRHRILWCRQPELFRQTGSSLIEILITLIVVAIGLLGLASMQVLSMKNLNSTNMRYVASVQAHNIAERMRANRTTANNGGYNDLSVNGTESMVSCSSGCSGNALVNFDAYNWGQQIKAHLPSGAGTIESKGNMHTITISWSEQHTGASIGTDDAAPDSRQFELKIRI